MLVCVQSPFLFAASAGYAERVLHGSEKISGRAQKSALQWSHVNSTIVQTKGSGGIFG